MLRKPVRTRQTLVIDGDDTLWENNVYFEQSIEDFIDFLGHARLTRAQVRDALDQIERLNARANGYGTAAFARNLRQTYEQLAERQIDKEALDHVMGLARRITESELVLLPHVRETLEELRPRQRLLLFTKGQEQEQRLKVERSGLQDQFEAVVITAEKDLEAYQRLLSTHGIDARRAWMVGNSPRSDIIPALDAGMGAVFIPHASTWRLELADVPRSARLLSLDSFGKLLDHF